MTRTIRGEKLNIEKLIDDAIATADGDTLNITAAENYLRRMGHTAPSQELIGRVAREMAILAVLTSKTGAAFNGQLGKIGFSDRNLAINQVNAYLNRRNSANHARWTENHRGY